MRLGIHGLDQLADRDLFQVLAEGIPLIVDNAVELAASADSLFQNDHRRTSLIMRGAAEEEAGKVLVLIDYVRCPRNSEKRGKILARFSDHVPKLIHSEACSYPGIHSFCEMCKFVRQGCEQWYLDGPNGIDWIFPNEIRARRERNLYVDYVRDPTIEDGDASWWPPFDPFMLACWCVTPDSVRLVRGLVAAGACSAKGLAVLAEIWRGFEPCPDTDRAELRRLNDATLDRLVELGDPIDDDVRSFVVFHWPFPLWPLAMDTRRPSDGAIQHLRDQRSMEIESMESTSAKRDPEPAISRSKVAEMSDAWAEWWSDREALYANRGGSSKGLRIRSADDFGAEEQLPSYRRLACMLGALNGEERVSLAALAHFARFRQANWPAAHQWAVDTIPTISDTYQLGLGCWWRAGMSRWESVPGAFSAGQMHRAGHSTGSR